MVPKVLEILEFRSNNEAHRPVIEAIKNPAASRRGMEADWLPNPGIRIASLMFRRRAAGNLTHTQLKYHSAQGSIIDAGHCDLFSYKSDDEFKADSCLT
jgi:hypothetical protein